MNTSDRETLASIVYKVNNPAYGDYRHHEDTADAVAAAGFIGPNETAELHQVVAALQATIASLRAAEQERLQQQANLTQVQSSTAGAIATNRLGSTA
ncbi:hypothetical protein [Rhodococcus ruber]|uniref:hypothetical protein n=1 Tax=Rhodococcus ruber TaxID=1830 RepID=UPI0037843443